MYLKFSSVSHYYKASIIQTTTIHSTSCGRTLRQLYFQPNGHKILQLQQNGLGSTKAY